MEDITCECDRGPREVAEITDEEGLTRWFLLTHCTECLEEGW